ncbi:serine carboxypeptidase-like 51 [Tripterygium wilfordii]|uniref:serine carboxypeptidase-like 51 n=1 Tax=Tripterygium wilfordii TaxID=458696 RepID=UPI0018F84614|nr:serine carboxypeptidase-like 51 [Tripterygium wilfordii]
MDKHYHLLLLFLLYSFSSPDSHLILATRSRNREGSEFWGYVEVRPKAHLFWWHYKSPHSNRVKDPYKPWPIILWLQGGPGGSGVASANFLQMGPLDASSNPRYFTWLRKADLLFVDSPVGTGFSYVEDEDENLLAKSDKQAATDLITLLKHVFKKNDARKKRSLYIFGESYGGKIAVALGLEALEAVKARELKLQFEGVVLGSSWISPQDFVFSWGSLLKDMSRIDDNSLKESNRLALQVKQQIEEGKYRDARSTWAEMQRFIYERSNHVDFLNFLLDYGAQVLAPVNFKEFMNGPIRDKLQIIPTNVTWEGERELVFDAFADDFMKPRIVEVDKLLSKGVNVVVYNGQLDLICSTKGVEAWVQKLRWDGLETYLSLERQPLYCEGDPTTKGFRRSYQNFTFYWILNAGHAVPANQPCISLQMVGEITKSPSQS